jgi:two-component system response regulator PilR (NtrC family)
MSTDLKVLILDDEPKMGKILSRILEREGHDVSSSTDPREALRQIQDSPVDLVITDLKMPEMDGLEFMKQARGIQANLDVIMMTAYATAETAVEAMKEGAFDYLIKPFPNEEMVMVVARVAEHRGLREENKRLKETLSVKFDHEQIIAASHGMREVMNRVAKVAASDVSVLLRGESGTGKEILATAIHERSFRLGKPLIRINCGALPESLLESELFGHIKGAFTGAVETRKGLFEEADGGSIFLDEIGEISPALQVKLLRVLQSGEFQRVGDARSHQVDVRIIAATHRDLEKMIEQNTFRSDLYYRLNVVPIVIPPLRDRPDDIPALIDHFRGRLRERSNRTIQLEKAAFDFLTSYNWPGNIRELENALEHACVMCEENTIHVKDLPSAVQNTLAEKPGSPGHQQNIQPRGRMTLDDIEKTALIEALEAVNYNHTRAAKCLGITRRTLGYRLDKYDLPRKNPVSVMKPGPVSETGYGDES